MKKMRQGETEAEALPRHWAYVVGFMFSADMRFVALIRKARPDWQRGKLNGIGGKIEEGETVREAMVREFREETGYQTQRDNWQYYAAMGGVNDDGSRFRCHCFATIGDMEKVHWTEEDEPVLAVSTRAMITRRDLIDNVGWLILLAMDHLADGRPGFVEVEYP